MKIFMVGANHKTTPVEIRGKFAISAAQLRNALDSLHHEISPGLILCTCNRTEIYILSENIQRDRKACLHFLNLRAKLPIQEVKKYTYTHQDIAVVRHLFQVASGLDSMITGEYEILGQVRRALEAAQRTALVSHPLLELFRCAVRAGRRVRSETKISRNAQSVSSAAVNLAAQAMGGIRHRNIVVIGAGEAGLLVTQACRARGATRIVVVSRSRERGTELAARLQGTWVEMTNLKQELTACDLAVCCSGAPHPILKLKDIEAVMNMRSNRPLVIVDIAVPQDVEKGVKNLENIFLFDIDELTSISASNLKERQRQVQQAREIVEEEVNRFIESWEIRRVKPLIGELVKKAERIRQAQLDITLKKLTNLSTEEKVRLEAMSKAIVKKILHGPIQCLKNNHKEQAYAQIISELFRLGGHHDR